jgi:predicted PurR-regulated permease PerM
MNRWINDSMTQSHGFASNSRVDLLDHLKLTGTALKHWLIVQSTDALIVGLMWLIGLEIIRVPLAPLWAVLGAALQFVPHFGPLLALCGPAIVGGLSGGWMRLIYVLILYVVIVITEAFVLQPYLMKRTVKVPIWASILAPIVLGFVIPFWGVLLAAPLLAVVYTYRNRMRA